MYDLRTHGLSHVSSESSVIEANHKKTEKLELNHPELSGCITTLTVRNANFGAAMDTLI